MNKKQLDSLFTEVDSMSLHGRSRQEMIIVDSIYRTFTNIDDVMLFRKYDRGVTNKFRWSEFDLGLVYSDSALKLVERHRDDPLWDNYYIQAYTSRGSLYLAKEQWNQAIDNYFKARNRSSQTKCGYAAFPDHYIGLALYRQKRFEKARTYFKKAIQIIDDCPEEIGSKASQKIELINNVALCHNELGQIDSSRFYTQKALEFLEYARVNKLLWKDQKGAEQKYAGKKASILVNMAKFYDRQNQVDSAESFYLQSIRYNTRYKTEHKFVLMTQADLATLYLREMRPGPAGVILNDMESGLDTVPYTNASLRYMDLSAKLAEQTGQQKLALLRTREYHHVRDSVDSITQKNSLLDVTTQLQSKQQELEISLLKKSNVDNRSYLLFAVLVIVLTGFIIFILGRNNRRARQNMLELQGLNYRINDQNNQLAIANRDKERLLQVVAHDLRSPVGLAAYAAESILAGAPGDEKDNKSLKRIKQATNQAMLIINELLSAGHNGHAAKDEQLVDLAMIIQSETEMMAPKLSEKNQQIHLSGTDKSLVVRAASSDLSRVFNNLMNNAIKFSPTGSTIRVQLSSAEGFASLSVQDSGVGIPEDSKDKIFEFLTPARQSGTLGETSFGLGLSICKRIVESYGGEISFTSVRDSGSTFYVKLPLSNKV